MAGGLGCVRPPRSLLLGRAWPPGPQGGWALSGGTLGSDERVWGSLALWGWDECMETFVQGCLAAPRPDLDPTGPCWGRYGERVGTAGGDRGVQVCL